MTLASDKAYSAGARGTGLVVEPQPDDVTCGPACLHAVYRFYGDAITLAEVAADTHMLEYGGTLDVFLANHALRRGYQATLYTYNLTLFDPTWFSLPREEISARLNAQYAHKNDRRLRLATRGYQEFLELGGRLRFEDLEPALIRGFLKRNKPVITGLSATYLYREMRDIPRTNTPDDVRGEPVGHFVVLTRYEKETREVFVADPYATNPLASSRYYPVGINRLIGAILLGITTYDANLLVIEPQETREPRGSREPGESREPSLSRVSRESSRSTASSAWIAPREPNAARPPRQSKAPREPREREQPTEPREPGQPTGASPVKPPSRREQT